MPTEIFMLPELQPFHISALVALTVFALALLAGRSLRAREAVRRRTSSAYPVSTAGVSALERPEEHLTGRLMASASRVLSTGERGMSAALRNQLIQAGIFSESAAPIYVLLRLCCAALLPLGFLSISNLLPFDVPASSMSVYAALLVGVGLVGPPIILDFMVKRMRQKYRDSFPDLMDLLVVCVEAGQSVQSALQRVGREMMWVCPELGFNLHLVSLELRAGSTLHTALLNLKSRLGLEEVQSLAVLLKQSEELGVSISATLRVFSEEMRDKRLSRAETRANSLPVKMTVPLGLCIFPLILLVILFPAILRIRTSFL